MRPIHRSWKRLPRTYEEIHLMSLGLPDPLSGWGVPYPRASQVQS